MTSDTVGWLALLVGFLALARALSIKRTPNLTKPLEDEIESLQARQNKDKIDSAKLHLEIQKRDTVIERLKKVAREMRVTITLLRSQVRNMGGIPGYGAEYETGPLEGEGNE